MQFIAPDDLKLPSACLGDGGRRLRPLVAGISEDTLDEGEQAPRTSIEDERGAIAILYSGRMHDDVQQQAERIDQGRRPIRRGQFVLLCRSRQVECSTLLVARPLKE